MATFRFLVRAASALFILLGAGTAFVSCGDDEPVGDDSRQCQCRDDTCTGAYCPITFTLPSSCSALFQSATVTVGGATDNSATPNVAYQSCLGVAEGETQAVLIAATSLSAPEVQTTCTMAGDVVEVPYCTLRFDLGSSCDGRLDSATVLIDGEEVGETTPSTPLVPCHLLAEGDTITGTIRAGTQFVLTGPLTCSAGGSEYRLTMECQ